MGWLPNMARRILQHRIYDSRAPDYKNQRHESHHAILLKPLERNKAWYDGVCLECRRKSVEKLHRTASMAASGLYKNF